MSLKEKADDIIHSSAATSAAASGALSQFIGSDTNLVVPVATKMVKELGELFGRELDESIAAEVASQLLPTTGNAALWIGVVPIIGNIARGGMTATAVKKAGWAVFDALEEGEEISSLSRAKWQDYLERAKHRIGESER